MIRRGGLLLALWLAGLAALAVLAVGRLEVTGDLREFMPAPRTADQRLLLDTLGQGPGSRLLLLAVSGADAETRVAHSRALRDALLDVDGIRRVANGEFAPDDAIDPALLPYRYLLTPAFDRRPLDAATLRDALQARLQDLGSPAAAAIEPWIPSDPTLELLRLAESWQPALEPERDDGVWVSADHASALLVVETAAGGFDPAAQRAVIDGIGATHAALAAAADAPLALEISGPGAFSVLLQARTSGDASRLGASATLGIVLLLVLAYRSLRLPLLAALPIASGALAALACVSLLFGSVHGITLAFGFTLLGLAQDYPVHLLSQRRPQSSPQADMQAIWPTLAAGVGSTCLAYLAFLAAGVTGLTQLALFAITGLLVAAACTRWLLPGLLPAQAGDVSGQRWLQPAQRLVGALPRLRRVAWLAGLLAIALLATVQRPAWDDNLAHLTPVPPELLQRDRELRAALGAPDVRYLLVLEAASTEALLQASEALAGPLQALVERGVVDAVELPSELLPSRRTQQQRQAGLPTPESLQAMLAEASAGLPFRAGLFAPFAVDVEAARLAPLLDPARLADSPLGTRLQALLPDRDGRPLALLGLSGVHDPAALAAFADAQGPGVYLLDLKAASESLSASYRQRVLLALGAALLLLVAGVWVVLRRRSRMLRVVAPVLLAAAVTVLALHWAGIAFTLFHLVALILTVGLGLDYALFFEHAGDAPARQRRTLHANLVCAASTLLVFGLLATSSIPVLQAIGLTAAIGVALQLLFAATLAQHREARHART